MDTAAYIAELEESNRQLRARVAQLELLLEQALAVIEELKIKKTSQNSNLPPSKDLAKKAGSLREKTGRKAGGQPGHSGHTLQMQAIPDKVEKLISNYCTKCGCDLTSAEAVLSEKRQVIDIPPLRAVCTQYEQYERTCPCCSHRQRPDFAPHITNHIQYGEHVHSLVMYLHAFQYIPFRRMQDLFIHCFQLPISTGSLENIVRKMACKGEDVYEFLRQQVTRAQAVGSDETGLKVNGKNQWAWTWQNKLFTFIAVSVSRSAAIIEELFPGGFKQAVLVSDRWKPQLNTPAKGHQLCLAHLLRELNYLSELYNNSTWAAEMRALLRQAIRLKQLRASFLETDPQVKHLESQVDKLLDRFIDKESHPKLATFQHSLINCRKSLLTFLYDAQVPYDNNGSERAIRNFKVKLKVSGQFKSGQQSYCILRSIIDTAIKNQNPVMQVCRALFNCIPKPAV